MQLQVLCGDVVQEFNAASVQVRAIATLAELRA
jgi:hypothetical protein